MLNDEHWNMMPYDPLPKVNEFPINLDDYLSTDGINYLNSRNVLIAEEVSEKIALSFESDQYLSQTSSTHSPQTEVHRMELICSVCGAPAHGYNFDQITCESCKAFFRRNALKNKSNLKCRFSGCCIINIHTRRQCTYCRLKKCFDVNMRKEWIRTEEERELRLLKNHQKEQRKLHKLSTDDQSLVQLPIVIRKKKRILPLTIKSTTQTFDIQKITSISKIRPFGIHRNLADDDKILLNNIVSVYKYGADRADSSHVTRYTSSSSLTQFINDETINHQSLVYFFKYIPEFKQFDINDQILLIKCNMVDIIHLHLIIVQNFQEPPEMATHMSNWITPDFHRQMSNARHKFDRFMKYPLILQITLIIFLFSINLSIPRGCGQSMNYRNIRKLYENQNFYITLLWRYLNYLFGENEAIQSIQIIVMQILRYQLLMNEMDNILRKSGVQDIHEPLMRSVFGLT